MRTGLEDVVEAWMFGSGQHHGSQLKPEDDMCFALLLQAVAHVYMVLSTRKYPCHIEGASTTQTVSNIRN